MLLKLIFMGLMLFDLSYAEEKPQYPLDFFVVSMKGVEFASYEICDDRVLKAKVTCIVVGTGSVESRHALKILLPDGSKVAGYPVIVQKAGPVDSYPRYTVSN